MLIQSRRHIRRKARSFFEPLEDRTLLSTLSPANLVGHQLTLTPNSGSGPYPTSGSYLLVVAADNSFSYGELGLSAGSTDNFGTYTYTQNPGNIGIFAATNATRGVTENISFFYSDANDGIYTLTSTSGTQAGSFTQTPAPAANPPVAGTNLQFNFAITNGHGHFASAGAYAVTTASSGVAYTLTGFPGELSAGNGIYAYTVPGAGLANITEHDSGSGVITQDMNFPTSNSGSFVIMDSATDSWQLGTFTVAAPTANVAARGFFDSASSTTLSGWAFDDNAGAASITIRVDVDGSEVAIAPASQFRGDLASPLGSSYHGFSYTLPISLAFGAHTATVYAVDSTTGALTSLGSRAFETQPALFDEAWYDAHNPDVAAAIAAHSIASGWAHYLAYGQHEGRDPSAYFDESYYRTSNPDVMAAINSGAFASGFEHYIRYDQAEVGRNPTPYFNESFYRSNYPDVVSAINAGAFVSGYQHFLEFGTLENRDPSLLFNPVIYLQKNPDVAAAIGHGVRSAFDHFMQFGRFEGRQAT